MVPQTSNGHPVFDKFPFPQNFECPWDRKRVAGFQQRIDKIAGKGSNGRSNVRLIWPGDSDESISMHTVRGEKRARYRLWTDSYRCTRVDAESGLEVVEDIDVDITPPRFMLEQFHEPEEEAFNPGVESGDGQGYYTHLFTVSLHDEHCCSGRESRNRRLCLGLYVEPNESTLGELQRLIRLRDEDAHGHRIGEQVSEEELSHDMREMKDWKEKYDQHLRSAYLDAAMNALDVNGWRLFNFDQGKRSKFHFLKG